MKTLDLLPIGNFDERLLREIAPALADAFRVPVRILGERLDPQFAFHRERQQYHSSEILRAMQEHLCFEQESVLADVGGRVGRTLLSAPAASASEETESSDLPGRTARPTQPWRVLGVTSVDLYIPILTFVFGEAQMGGPCAVVSFHRLMQEFYGLPADPSLLIGRLIKEAVHEVGHTLDLTHCDDYSCAMAPSHAVEWIDLKEWTLCANCQGKMVEVVG